MLEIALEWQDQQLDYGTGTFIALQALVWYPPVKCHPIVAPKAYPGGRPAGPQPLIPNEKAAEGPLQEKHGRFGIKVPPDPAVDLVGVRHRFWNQQRDELQAEGDHADRYQESMQTFQRNYSDFLRRRRHLARLQEPHEARRQHRQGRKVQIGCPIAETNRK